MIQILGPNQPDSLSVFIYKGCFHATRSYSLEHKRWVKPSWQMNKEILLQCKKQNYSGTSIQYVDDEDKSLKLNTLSYSLSYFSSF